MVTKEQVEASLTSKLKPIHLSPWLNISSPDHDHATLDSPVFLSNELPSSPTTGKLSSLLPFDKPKDVLFDNNTPLFAYQSISGSSHDPTNIGLEPDDSEDYEQILVGGDLMPSGAPPDDGYNWRKYGQKLVKGSEYPRSYYKCTHPNCDVKKKVERSREGYVIEIVYAESHNHPKPPPNRGSGIGSSSTRPHMQIDGIKQEGFGGTNENVYWPSPVSTELEYASNSGSMQVHSGEAATASFFGDDDEDDLWSHMSDSLMYDGQVDEPESKRRKLDAYAGENSVSTRTSREPKVVVLTTSDTDILNDGYRWRKYGQKVVKGNPNPRSYYKCTANGCLVTKHVERASADFKDVLTTYIGKHNHTVPPARNGSNVSSHSLGETLQGSLATQNQNHNVQYAMPYSRSEGLVTDTSSLFDYQPHLIPSSGFPYYIGQSEFSNLSAPDLTIGQEMLTNLPAPNNDDPAGLTLPLAAQPNVEPVSQQELDLSTNFLIYRDIVSRLP